MAKATNNGMSYDTKVIVTVLLLIFVFPIGLITMWMWMKWPTWVKVILSLVLVLPVLLAILLAIALIAINPKEQFSKANNTKRSSDVNAIANAIMQYKKNNNDALPLSITETPTEIGTQGVDLCTDIVPEYIPAIPSDPLINNGEAVIDCTAQYRTGYSISKDDMGKVTIKVMQPELDKDIVITR